MTAKPESQGTKQQDNWGNLDEVTLSRTLFNEIRDFLRQNMNIE